MWGQGLRPDGYHPLADQLTQDQLNEFMAVSHKHAVHIAHQMPDHQDYIAANCAAPSLEMTRTLP
jgi:tryptophan 7-halogenase